MSGAALDRLMSGAALDRLLAVLLAVVGATGLLTLRAGTPDLAWLFVIHGLLAGALLAAIVLKLRGSLARAARARRLTRLTIGLLVSMLALGSVLAGYAWVASGSVWSVRMPSLGSITVLTLHVWLGLAVLPIMAVHLLPRRWRLLRPGSRVLGSARSRLLTRRSVLAGAGLTGVAALALSVTDVAERLSGGARRFTGSRLLPSGGVPPATTFFGEAAPAVDWSAWRLTVGGRVARRASLTLEDVGAFDLTEVEATLDCTSGWAMATTWIGLPMTALLAAAGIAEDATTIEVRSLTGWGATFPISDAGRLLLATGVGGAALPRENGAPMRLVAPNRRGLDWVKWVAEVRVS